MSSSERSLDDSHGNYTNVAHSLTGALPQIYTLQYCKLLISLTKYIPQALLNYRLKSTVGWSIENILLDLTGGILSLAQLLVDASLQPDWSYVTRVLSFELSIATDTLPEASLGTQSSFGCRKLQSCLTWCLSGNTTCCIGSHGKRSPVMEVSKAHF